MSVTITNLNNGNVEVKQTVHTGFDFSTITREFTARGSYVYQVMPNGREVQTCIGLLPTGPTLMIREDQTLESVIRKTLA